MRSEELTLRAPLYCLRGLKPTAINIEPLRGSSGSASRYCLLYLLPTAYCLLPYITIMKRFQLALLTVLLTASSVFAGEKVVFNSEGFAPMFPFSITKGAPDNITNVRTWSTPAPAGADGFLRIEGDHFVSDKGSVRFVGTNLCFTAEFPESHEDAERLPCDYLGIEEEGVTPEYREALEAHRV